MRKRRQSLNGDVSTPKPFVGVDGEGGNLANGYHAYFLLRAGDRYIVPEGNNVRLTTLQCLEFLADLPNDRLYVAFFFDYDVTKILEDLPWSKLDRLMDRSKRTRADGRGTFPVSFGPFELDYLPRKEFKVRKLMGQMEDPLTGGVKRTYSPWVVINDVGSFFQCKFVEALEKWSVGSPEQLDMVRSGKEERANFTLADLDTIAPYNAMEIQLLESLMDKFRDACEAVGYLPNKWQGPGQLAESAFKKHGVPLSKDIPLLNLPRYRGLLEFARYAFYGGRPEIMAIGPVNRPVWQWDINSAYPYAMLYLPCLIHGEWTHLTGEQSLPVADKENRSNYAICYGWFEGSEPPGKKPLWYGLPIRSKEGSICYPESGRGWYWNFEIEAAKHQKFHVEEAWIYRRECNCSPLEYVQDIYLERLRMGKNDRGMVLKLLLNSKYGKTVQSIGRPKYSNPIWGSFITAWCRSQIQAFIHTSPFCLSGEHRCGREILMIATDSICTWLPRTDIEESKDLGGWSNEYHPGGMFLVQPGLYFGTSGKRAKTRGVPLAVIEDMEQDFRTAFDRMIAMRSVPEGDVQVPQQMFVGIRYALHRHNLKLMGQWIRFQDPETGREGKTIRFDWRTKRSDIIVMAPNPWHSYIETWPKKGDPNVDSVPYARDIGGLMLRDALRNLFEAQPDWIQPLDMGDV